MIFECFNKCISLNTKFFQSYNLCNICIKSLIKYYVTIYKFVTFDKKNFKIRDKGNKFNYIYKNGVFNYFMKNNAKTKL